MSAPTTTAARFEAFEAHHGPLESGLADQILLHVMKEAVSRFSAYPQDRGTTLAGFVANDFRTKAADILSLMELAADWSADPMKAAARQLRAELDAKAADEAAAKKREEDAATQAAIRAKADAFMAQLQSGAVALG